MGEQGAGLGSAGRQGPQSAANTPSMPCRPPAAPRQLSSTGGAAPPHQATQQAVQLIHQQRLSVRQQPTLQRLHPHRTLQQRGHVAAQHGQLRLPQPDGNGFALRGRRGGTGEAQLRDTGARLGNWRMRSKGIQGSRAAQGMAGECTREGHACPGRLNSHSPRPSRTQQAPGTHRACCARRHAGPQVAAYHRADAGRRRRSIAVLSPGRHGGAEAVGHLGLCKAALAGQQQPLQSREGRQGGRQVGWWVAVWSLLAPCRPLAEASMYRSSWAALVPPAPGLCLRCPGCS